MVAINEDGGFQAAGGALSWKLWDDVLVKQATGREASSMIEITVTCGTITCFWGINEQNSKSQIAQSRS